MKLRNVAVLVGALALLLSTKAALAGEQDFTLVNKTGVEIRKVFISPHHDDSWGEDVLGRDTLDNHESVDIKFHRSETAEHWDLKIIDREGNSIVWENFNLLKISKIVLRYEGNSATAETE